MSPQLEDGYTRIADAILEKIAKTKLNGTQFRILMVVWRSTYGWQKKEHELSEGFLSNATGIHKQQIKRELKKLIEDDVITVIKEPTFNTGRVIAFNKNYAISYEVAKKIPPIELDTTTGSELDTPTGSGLATQNKDINKQYKEIYDFYLSLDLIKHKKYTKSISDAIKKVVSEYGVDETKELIKRHNEVVNKTKYNGDYKVRPRGIGVFFSQKINNTKGSPYIYEEYLEGGSKYEKYLNKTEDDYYYDSDYI